MKKILASFIFAILGIFVFAGPAFASCNPTDFYRDGINMTAALINPDVTVTGDIDATGCNIGVYFDQDGVVDDANIFGSNYFGVLAKTVDKDIVVDVKNSTIHNIGEVPLNGSQHGVAIYYRAMNNLDTYPEDGSFVLTGEISGNTISVYQKGGITVNGGNASAIVKNNEVDGANLSTVTAANSVQFGYGATGLVTHNNIGGNQWCGAGDWSATAVLLYNSGSVDVIQNNIRGNSDIGIYAWASNSILDNNKIFDEGTDCKYLVDDIGLYNESSDNTITNNKVKGFVESYYGVDGGKNKVIPGP